MAVNKSFLALVLLSFLLCTGVTMAVSLSKDMLEQDDRMSLVAKHKHKHSGFSQQECPGACDYRCSKTAYKKACMFFCQKCCFKCRCVPPGTWAHKEVCPCYNNWKTKSGGPKCP